MNYTAQEKSEGIKKQLEIFSNWRFSPQDILMRDTVNFLRRNNISIFNKDGSYRGLEAILEDVANVEASKFEKS